MRFSVGCLASCTLMFHYACGTVIKTVKNSDMRSLRRSR